MNTTKEQAVEDCLAGVLHVPEGTDFNLLKQIIARYGASPPEKAYCSLDTWQLILKDPNVICYGNPNGLGLVLGVHFYPNKFGVVTRNMRDV